MLILALFLVIVAFVVFSLFGFLKQSKVIDFAWGLSYTDSSLIGQVNDLLKRELSVGLVKLTVSEKNREWDFDKYFVTSRSAIYEIWWFWFELVREFLDIFYPGPSWSLFYSITWFWSWVSQNIRTWSQIVLIFFKSIDHFELRF